MIAGSKKDLLFLILSGVFITNAVMAELIGAKLIQIGPFVLPIGIFPWPVVFLTTDIINEYFGRKGVRRLSVITASLIAYVFVVLYATMKVPAAEGISTVTDEQYNSVFGQSQLIIIGSIIAFLVGQLVDSGIFWLLRNKTGAKMLWLRSTGSTAVSQLVDTFLVQGIAFWLPGKWTTDVFLNAALSSYTFKLMVALGVTPLIYLAHSIVDKYLGDKEAEATIHAAAEQSLHHKTSD